MSSKNISRPPQQHLNGQQALVVQQNAISHYSGPIPDAEALAKYRDISESFPERIFSMAELEQKSRLKRLEEESTRKNIALLAERRNTLLGLIFAVMSVLLIMGAAVSCAYFNHPITGSIIGAGGICFIVAVFVYGSKNINKQ